jgi:Kef-type K+ transport system membrane component KefB
MILAAATAHHTEMLLSLFLMFTAAKLMAEVFERIGQPAVVGEILAGVLIGPSLLGWVAPSEITDTIAEIGVVFLLFSVGLETQPAALMRVGKLAALVAVLGVLAPLAGGFGLGRAWGLAHAQSLFLGTAMVATSVGITARVLSSMNLLGLPTSRIVLGAAIIDDILGLLVLAVVSSMVAQAVNYVEITSTVALALGFVVLLFFAGAPLLNRLAPKITELRVGPPFFLVSIVLCLGLSVAAAYIGVAAIIGAFLAGVTLAEISEGRHDLHEQTRGLTELLVPFFLVSIGMKLQLDVFTQPGILLLTLLVTLVAVATKFVACGLAVKSLGWRAAAQVGAGMVPRGEVGIVVAQIGVGLGVIQSDLFGVVLFMSVATTLIAPPALRVLFAGSRNPDAPG